MKQIFTIIILICSFFVNAQEKLKYITSNAEGHYNLLTDTVKESFFGDENGKFLEAWIKVVKIKKVKNKSVMTETMTKFMVDCNNNNKFKILARTEYNSKGGIVKSENFDEYGDFISAVPESTGATIVHSICAN
jgi:hypothetical protein